MIALRGVRRGFHFAQERVHLVEPERAPGPHAAVAGHGRADRVEPRLDAAFRARRQLMGKVAHERLHVALPQQRRGLAHDHGAGAEAFENEAAARDFGAVFEENRRVFVRHFDDFGDQQQLAGDAFAQQRGFKFFVDDAFVGGVLVDENDAVFGLGDDVGFVQLGAGEAETLRPARFPCPVLARRARPGAAPRSH